MSQRPRACRLVATVTAVALAITGVLVVAAAPAGAATRGFTPAVYSTNTTGDVTIRGNTLMTCLAGSTQAQTGGLTCSAAQTGGSQQNNNYFMTYVDSDGTTGIGASTFDSSTATVTVPAGATVLYAALSWGAITSAGSLMNYPALTGVAAPNPAQNTSALFQTPGATAYSTVTSTTTDTNATNYQAFADVTTAVRTAGSGIYTVANVQAGTGGGNYAGWSLAVAFSDPTMPVRNLAIFTGYNSVSGSATAVDIPVSGFTTPATGQVKTTVGVVAYEGDKGSTGDGMSIGSTALFNSLNPVADVFNSSITDLNVAVTNRDPSYANALGFDIDRFDATGALANGSTSTTIHLTSSSETYYPGMITFATDLYASTLSATKTVVDVNGGTVNRSDVLSYSVAVRNDGGDGATATVLTDTVPNGTTYVANSLVVGGTAVTDAAGDDVGEVNAGNVTARLGSGATATAGGLLTPAATSTVAFRVTVNTSVVDAATVSNTASFSSNAQTGGAGTAGASNTVTSAIVVGPSFTAAIVLTATGEVGAAYSSGLTVNAGTGTGPFVWTISSGALPSGLAIGSDTGLITGTPTANGNSTFTIKATDVNGRFTTRSQTVSVAAAPGVTFAPPSGEVGVAYSAQPSVAGGTGPFTWAVSAGALPAGLTINPSTGLISGTPSTAGTSNFTVKVTDSVNVVATQAVSVVTVAAPVVTFTPPSGEVGAAYSAQPTVTSGVGPFTWAVSAGTLPAGLTINSSTGLISGTPTTAGTSNFTVRATDANNVIATQAVSAVIVAAPVVTFTPPSGEVGVAYSGQPTVSSGVGAFTWAISAGALPAGLTINSSTGLISGTPTTAGTSDFTVRATDANNVIATQAVSAVIVAAPALTFPAPPAAELGVSYSNQLTFTGGVGPYTWSVSAGSLPAGLTLGSSGLLSGTPTAVGSSPLTVRLVDSNGIVDTRAATLVVNRSASSVGLSAAASVTFGSSIVLTATVAPTAGTGTVTFTDVPTTLSGTTVTLGSGTVTGGTATLGVTLSAFGVHAVTASYSGDATRAPSASSVRTVTVYAYAGELIVSEFRSSGPAGTGDAYLELLNRGAPVPLAGVQVTTTSGSVTTLPADTGILATGRSYLIAGSAFSLRGIATPDLVSTLGSGGVQVVAPDTAATATDAVGPAAGFHAGTPLPPVAGSPTAQYAWVRRELAGVAVDTRDNATDFQLVSTTLTLVGGQQPTLGSASPTGTADPFQTSAGLTSTLLDPSAGGSAAPNRSVVGGQLVVRRTITNNSGATVTVARVRISALSEQFGAPRPGGSQPATVANLRAVNPAAATEVVTVTGGGSKTVNNLSVDTPISGGLGGGLNSTLTLPLPGGGLAPGATINVAFTFAVDTHGTFWFGYDVDAE